MAENTKQFFQITEAARACGLSRSTLMRMEERGLLTPVFTAPDSGRRYYDNHNVARIMQIEKFKAMGLGSKEIADYFAQGGEAEVLLEALETRLRDLQRSVEEMRLRAAEGESLSVQMMELPAVTCRIRWCEGLTTAERYRDMYDFYGACVRKGCVLSDEPTRNLLLRITDPALLSATGGIVQGMSGSPILQNGRIVGAVTHVLLNDPTRGYGIFIENMLDMAG